MIALGIILIVLGGVSVFFGNQLNNNMEIRMNQFFNSGTTDPGSGFVIVGIIVLIVGGIFLVAGVVRAFLKSKNGSIEQNSEYISKINTLNELKSKGLITQQDYDNEISNISDRKIYCQNCGTAIEEDYSFCPKCGSKRLGGRV